ncbi:protein of unknown function (plasmid) [Cupriavidus taiwanensis]|nr:protein of unknown function [Cupriavidus taiwanensis]
MSFEGSIGAKAGPVRGWPVSRLDTYSGQSPSVPQASASSSAHQSRIVASRFASALRRPCINQ